MCKLQLEGFDEQLSCMLRRVDGEVVLLSCPFQQSDGFGDSSCLLLMCKEHDNVMRDISTESIKWRVDNLMVEVFGEGYTEDTMDYEKLTNWKFPACPLSLSKD